MMPQNPHGTFGFIVVVRNKNFDSVCPATLESFPGTKVQMMFQGDGATFFNKREQARQAIRETIKYKKSHAMNLWPNEQDYHILPVVR